MGGTEYRTKIVHTQLRVDVGDNLLNLFTQTVGGFIVDDHRVHVNHQIDVHLCADLTLDVVDDVVAGDDVAVGRNFGVYRGKDTSRTIIMDLKVVDADDTLVGGDAFCQLLHHLWVGRLSQQRVAGFDDQFDAGDGDKDCHRHTHPAVHRDGGQVVDHRADEDCTGGIDVVEAVGSGCLERLGADELADGAVEDALPELDQDGDDQNNVG